MEELASAGTRGTTIVVAGAGQIGTPLVERLCREGHRVVWLSRTRPKSVPSGAEHRSVDIRDAEAVANASRDARAVIAAVNPATYDAKVWAETLPAMHRGLIEGVGRSGARLVVLDALYLYSLDDGPLAPSTRQAPDTEKGRIRKSIADMLVAAQAAGSIRAVSLRAPDFWGPDLASALLTREAIAGLRAGRRPLLVGNPDAVHAFSHRDDVVDALIRLAFAEDDVEGKVFHAPVVHVTPREMIRAFCEVFGVDVEPRVAPRWLLRVAGLFSRSTGGLVEMIPQWESPYLVDDSGYRARFGVTATTLDAGVISIAAA